MVHKINATKLYYLDLPERLMLRPLLVALGGEAGFGQHLMHGHLVVRLCHGSGVSFPCTTYHSFMSPLLYHVVHLTTGLHHTAVILHILFIATFNTNSVQSFNSSCICAVSIPQQIAYFLGACLVLTQIPDSSSLGVVEQAWLLLFLCFACKIISACTDN
jgi:hypothetical protein